MSERGNEDDFPPLRRAARRDFVFFSITSFRLRFYLRVLFSGQLEVHGGMEGNRAGGGGDRKKDHFRSDHTVEYTDPAL